MYTVRNTKCEAYVVRQLKRKSHLTGEEKFPGGMYNYSYLKHFPSSAGFMAIDYPACLQICIYVHIQYISYVTKSFTSLKSKTNNITIVHHKVKKLNIHRLELQQLPKTQQQKQRKIRGTYTDKTEASAKVHNEKPGNITRNKTHQKMYKT